MKICAVIPCYKERDHIADVVTRCLTHVPTVLVVDDGSLDGTADAAHQAGAQVITHPVNMGKGVALRTGFDWALANAFDAVLTLDGDGQHNPDEIPLLLAAQAADPNIHVVLGSRMHSLAAMPLVRRCSNRTTSRLVSLLGHIHVKDSQTGFRLIMTDVLRRVHLTCRRYDAESEILIKAGRAGFHVAEVPVSTIYLPGGESSINPVTEPLRFIKLIIRSLFTH